MFRQSRSSTNTWGLILLEHKGRTDSTKGEYSEVHVEGVYDVVHHGNLPFEKIFPSFVLPKLGPLD